MECRARELNSTAGAPSQIGPVGGCAGAVGELSQEVELTQCLICVFDGFGLGFEWSVVGSFQGLTRSRDTCPIPTRITFLIGLAIEHCELCSDVDRRSPFTAGALGLRSVEILVSKSACSLGATIPRPRLDASGAEWVLEVAVHVIFGANLECQHGVIRRVFGGDLGKCPLGAICAIIEEH